MSSIEEIKKQLDYHTALYVKGQGEISDEEFDALELKYYHLTGEKYVQNVADEDGDEPLPFLCGSQNKIKDENSEKDLSNFLGRYEDDLVNMDKYDGITVVVEYIGSFIKCWKKKNEKKGPRIDYITQFGDQFPQLPYKLLIRGEYLIYDSDFNDMKPYLNSIGMKASHSRNVVNAATSRVNPNPEILAKCKFIPYSLYFTVDQPEYGIIARPLRQTEQLEFLRQLGFHVPTYKIYKQAEMNRKMLLDYLDQRKNEAGYRIDGTILTFNIPLGLPTGGNPNYSVAIKKDTIGFSYVRGCEFSLESKDGYLTPVIQIDPTVLITEVTNITLYNGRTLWNHQLSPGAKIAFTQGGDIIPKFLWVESPGSGVIFSPSIPYQWNKNGVELMVLNPDSFPQVQCAKLKHFLEMLEVKEWGLLTIWKLYHSGITDLGKLISVSPQQLMMVDGIQEKSANNLVNELNRGIRKSNMAKIMAGSCIFGEGLAEIMINKFLTAFPNWRYQKIRYNDIVNQPGFGQVRAKQIADKLPVFINWLNSVPSLEQAIPQVEKTTIKSHALSGFIFYFTGFTDEYLKGEVESYSGTVSGNFTKSVNVVVRKDDSYSSKKVVDAMNSGGKIRLMNRNELEIQLRQLRLN